jgi:hypothetical protein
MAHPSKFSFRPQAVYRVFEQRAAKVLVAPPYGEIREAEVGGLAASRCVGRHDKDLWRVYVRSDPTGRVSQEADSLLLCHANPWAYTFGFWSVQRRGDEFLT